MTGTSDAAWAAFAVLERLDAVYDLAGRPVKESLIASGITQAVRQVAYDAAGRPSCTALRMNPAAFGAAPASACSHGAAEDVLFGYDLLGRGTSVRFAVAGSDILASYDKAGR